MTLSYWLRYCPTLSETFVYREAQGLIDRGHTVRALAIGAREAGAQLPSWTLRYPPDYTQVLAAGARVLSTRGGRRARAWLSEHQPVKQVAKALWAASTLETGEGIHCHFAGESAEWAYVAKLAVGAEYSVTVHAADLYKARPSFIEVLQQAKAVLTVSHHQAGLLRQMGVNARVQACGVDAAAWPCVRIAADGPLLFIGRDVPKKGLKTLIQALSLLPDTVRLKVIGVGSGPQLDGRVRYLGPRSQKQILEEMHGCSLMVLPCQTAQDGDRDGLPVALMEAMASGLPVLTTSLPGLEDLVDQQVGWIVPPADPLALAREIAQALYSPEALHQRGQAGRARIHQDFTLAQQVDAVEAIWGEH